MVFSSPIPLLFQVFPSRLFVLLITEAPPAAHLTFGRAVKDLFFGFIITLKTKDYYVLCFKEIPIHGVRYKEFFFYQLIGGGHFQSGEKFEQS